MLKFIAALSLLASFSPVARAEGDTATRIMEQEAAAQTKLEPATRYSGRTPIDLTNGIPFNNGTYGRPNANYEKWATAPTLVPGVSDLVYPYADRGDFIAGCEESSQFVENAIANWRLPPTSITKPEVLEYRTSAIAAMQPALDKFNDTLRALKSAGKSDWEKNQSDARRALVDLRSTYSSLHKNVH